MPSSMAFFISGESLLGIEGFSRADADRGEARHEFGFSDGIGRAELQDEVQDVEELQRGLLFCWRQRLDEVNGRRGLGRGVPRKAESGCAL